MRAVQQVFVWFSKILVISFLALVTANSYARVDASAPKLKADASAKSATRGLLFEIKSGDKVAYLFG